MNITAKEYSDFQHFLSQECGIEIGENKQYLVKNRLSHVIQEFGLSSFSELLSQLHAGSRYALRLRPRVIDAMTTNETFWFRDDRQFDALRQEVLPELLQHKRGAIRIWSAACSSGQEPYTMSLCIEEMQKTQALKGSVQIVGTDISESILNEARRAMYSDLDIKRGLDTHLQASYFTHCEQGYQLKSEIMRRVRFQQLNLLQSFTHLGQFDIIFCRNVLIYFSDKVKRDILQRMLGILEPGGALFLSSTESVPMDLKGIEPVRGKQARYFKKSL